MEGVRRLDSKEASEEKMGEVVVSNDEALSAVPGSAECKVEMETWLMRLRWLLWLLRKERSSILDGFPRFVGTNEMDSRNVFAKLFISRCISRIFISVKDAWNF